jgi:predicted acyl esterase
MRDGTELRADVFLPSRSDTFPAILIITPYNREYIAAPLPDASLKSELISPNEYAYVVADWRGFFGSREAKRGRPTLTQAGLDGYDAVEWVAQQPWCNGRIGMWGASALGKIQFMTAMERPPHLVCALPMVTEHGNSYGQVFHGGVWKKGYAETAASVGWDLSRFKAHPTEDGFWEETERSFPHPSRCNVPMLIIGGWFDLHTEGVIDTFKRLKESGGPVTRQNIRLVLGPWTHSHVGKLKQGELEFPAAENVSDHLGRLFFDRWLRDKKDNGWDRQARIHYFQMGVNEWRDSDDWPPLDLQESVFHLHSGGKLVRDTPANDAGSEVFRYDPADPSPTVGGMNVSKTWDPSAPRILDGPADQRFEVEGRDDLVSFTSDELIAAVSLTGNARVALHVSSDRKDTDFAVRLTDVHPDGRSMLVTDGIQRMRFRQPGREELMEPGKVYQVTVVLSTTAYSFVKGHRIRILVSSSNSPRFEANANIDRRRLFGPSTLVATNRVHYGPDYPSALILPVHGGRGSGAQGADVGVGKASTPATGGEEL